MAEVDDKEKLPRFHLPLAEVLERRPLVLDLASGGKAARKKEQGRITLDKLDLPSIDIVCNLDEGLPFIPDESVDAVYSGHSLEHIPNYLYLMNDIHRVLKPNGQNKIAVPHFSNPYYYSDPTHIHFFGLYTFYYFSDHQSELRRKVPSYYFQKKYRIDSLRLSFVSPFKWINTLYKGVEWLVNRSRFTQELYEHSFCYVIPCYGIEATLTPIKEPPEKGT